MKGILLGEDQLVAEWAYKTFNLFPLPVNKALGILDNESGNLLGACLFQAYNGINIDLSYYGPKTLTVGIVRFIATVAVGEYRVARLTVVTSRRNKKLIKALLRIGFRLEGAQRRFYGHEDIKRNTAVRLVAFREELEKVAYAQKRETKE